MLDYEGTRAWTSGDIRHAYGTRDTILYALGVGAGADALDADELRLTYERDLLALPSLVCVLASPGPWMRERAELDIDFLRLVHGEQAITLHEPLAPRGVLLGCSRVVRIVDRGEGKGALLHVEKTLRNESDGRLVATAEQVLFLRGDGGFSHGTGGDPPAPAPPPVPQEPPHIVLELPTRPDAALLYRLCGDLNPLHVDPQVAARAGFARPILHGLATFGHACRGLVRACCQGDPRLLKGMRARLSAPVFPGETLRLQAWRLGPLEIAFECRVVERDVLVLSHGRASL